MTVEGVQPATFYLGQQAQLDQFQLLPSPAHLREVFFYQGIG